MLIPGYLKTYKGEGKMDGVKQFIKDEVYIWRFEFAKSWRRKYTQWQVKTADYYFPHRLRSLFYGSGRKQFLEDKKRYFGDNYIF